MTRFFIPVLTAAVMVAAQPAKPTQHASTATTASKTSTSKTTAAGKTSTAAKHGKTARNTHHARARRPAAPSYQLHPDPERYAQIQQALIDRGYFKGQANGQWGDDSVDALKRFQTDQKLDNDGKISAHSLTALGLGPKHDGTSASTVPLSATADSASPAPPSELPAQTTPPQTGPPTEELPPQ